MTRRRITKCGIALAIVLSPNFSTAEERQRYQLAPGDVVQLSVFGVADFGRRVTVNIDGDISVPFLGELRAEGKTIPDLRRMLAEALNQDGRIQAADVTVEMVEHRPFYVSGDVSRPGAIAYRPGLTVRHAIALAGGYDALRFRTENPLMVAPDLKSENESLWIDFARQQALIISLEAEIAGQADLDLTPLYSMPLSRSTLEDLAKFERNDFDMRRETYARQRNYLDALLQKAEETNKLLQETQLTYAESLAAQQKAVDRAVVSASKGVVASNRVDEERRSLSEIRSRSTDVQSRLDQNWQQREEVARSLQQLREQHVGQVNDRLREASIELEKLSARLKASNEKLLYTGAVKAQLRGEGGGLRLFIHRRFRQTVATIVAGEDTAIEADDVLEVSIRPEQMVAAARQ